MSNEIIERAVEAYESIIPDGILPQHLPTPGRLRTALDALRLSEATRIEGMPSFLMFNLRGQGYHRGIHELEPDCSIECIQFGIYPIEHVVKDPNRREPVQGAGEPGMKNPYPPKPIGTPCGDCGEFLSTVTIPMPPHWASSRERRAFCVDACIATEVLKLVYVHGIRTMNSCCGHARDIPATVIVSEEHVGIMLGLGYTQPYPDRLDIFEIPADRVTHIGPKQ